ncbi:hypothetical protein [Patulibacter minatonensis]|uniref:hypothetical protein n=1 Tax=Patulibacter minatonensis TaxID=298163 RepID=UPI00047EB314|nr:hypothetical protein [Patulibacter minatonensis]
MFDVSTTDPAGTKKLLLVMLVLGIIDVVLFVPLVLGMFDIIDSDSFVGPVGMVHGLAFLAIVGIGLLGAKQARWNVKFVAAVIISGAVGLVVISDLLIRRELDVALTAGA